MPEAAFTFADLFLKVGQFLIGRGDVRAKLRRENIERVATYLDGIAKTLIASADELEQKQLPHDHCTELYYCVQTLRDVLRTLMAYDEMLREEQIAKVGDILYQATLGPALAIQDVERSRGAVLVDFNKGGGFAHTSTIPQPDEEQIAVELRKMKEAAGLFRGLAATIRALP